MSVVLTRWARIAGALFLICFAAVVIPSCSLFEEESRGVKVRSNGRSVSIENDTEQRIYYNLFGLNFAAVIDWLPHFDEERSVAAGRSKSIDYADIMMEDDEEEAIVFWWTAVTRDGETVPANISSQIVDL